ncbi:MAG: hypothetical protein ACM3JD_02880 [Rudaea sp.]
MEPSSLKIGDAAPEFNLRAVITRPEVRRVDVRLSDWRGKKTVALVFHPFAFTAT